MTFQQKKNFFFFIKMSTKLNEKEIKDLKEAFEAFDLNGDGKLSKEEFENVFYVADLNLSKAEKKLIVNKYFLFFIK
jgi:Ca2+-binding EF-hand superfamily protein